MKIIITDIFEKKFLNKLKKYFSIQDLVIELKKDKTDIVLKELIHKVKLKLNLVEFRGIILVIHDDKVIPIMLYLKKDKQNGENIIWSTHKVKILEMQEKVSIDLQNGDFKIY